MQGLRPLARYFEFSGRSDRAEFWQFLALWVMVSFLLFLIDLRDVLEGINSGTITIPVWGAVFSVATIIPLLAATFRRLHDRNKSGWLLTVPYLLIFLSIALAAAFAPDDAHTTPAIQPLVFSIYLSAVAILAYCVVQLAMPGNEYENDYGAVDIAQPMRLLGLDHPAVVQRLTGSPAIQFDESDERLSRVERLADLWKRGILTDEEFRIEKAKILSGGTS